MPFSDIAFFLLILWFVEPHVSPIVLDWWKQIKKPSNVKE